MSHNLKLVKANCMIFVISVYVCLFAVILCVYGIKMSLVDTNLSVVGHLKPGDAKMAPLPPLIQKEGTPLMLGFFYQQGFSNEALQVEPDGALQ